MVKLLFSSNTAGSDGTFKMAPIGYTQVYMLWSILEGSVNEEKANRSKALPGIYILLKGKTQALYSEAFEMIEKYRVENDIPTPSWKSYLLDDEKAVQNVIEQYSSAEIEICFFHVNKNIVKFLVNHKLSSFVRKCKTDEELWFYGKLKQILVLPLLPLNSIHSAFKILKEKIVSFFRNTINNAYQHEQLDKFFVKIEENYYGNPEKMKKVCKYKKQIRGTNLIEATHGGFNKSILTPKHGNVNNLIHGLKCIDFQSRAVAVDFSKKGIAAFPKKAKLEQEREEKLSLYYEKLEKNEINVESFLECASELWIHKKFIVVIKRATDLIEGVANVESNAVENEDASENVDDLIDAIFVSDSPPKRVRKICTKYYGEEWMNF